MKTTRKTLIVATIMVASLFVTSCEMEVKDEVDRIGVEIGNSVVKLFVGSNQQTKEAESGDVITGEVKYAFEFSLTPDTPPYIAQGYWSLTSDGQNILPVASQGLTNGFTIKFNEPTNAILGVAGTYDGNNFNYENVSIVAEGDDDPPVDPDSIHTHPIKVKGMTIVSGVVNLEIGISRAPYPYLDEGTDWGHLIRRNGTNWENELAVTMTADSIFLTLQFPETNNMYIEFNVHCYVPSSEKSGEVIVFGGEKKAELVLESKAFRETRSHREMIMNSSKSSSEEDKSGVQWLDPGVYVDGQRSVFYTRQFTANNNTPYEASASYFGFRFKSNYNGHPAIVAYDETIVIYTTATTPPENTVPGEYGDVDPYIVRRLGNQLWVKDLTSSDFQWKYEEETTWNPLSLEADPEYTNYSKVSLPSGLEGNIHFRWGNGSGESLSPSSIMEDSDMYWDIDLEFCVMQRTTFES